MSSKFNISQNLTIDKLSSVTGFGYAELRTGPCILPIIRREVMKMAFTYGGGNPYFANQQTMFLQPSGSLYLIQNSSELTAIPTNMGTVAAICLPENIMYLKTSQNGAPVCYTYKLSEAPKPAPAPIEQHAPNNTEVLESRIATIEEQLSKLIQQLTPTSWDT